MDRGVYVNVNTDDPPMFATESYARVLLARATGLDVE